ERPVGWDPLGHSRHSISAPPTPAAAREEPARPRSYTPSSSPRRSGRVRHPARLPGLEVLAILRARRRLGGPIRIARHGAEGQRLDRPTRRVVEAALLRPAGELQEIRDGLSWRDIAPSVEVEPERIARREHGEEIIGILDQRTNIAVARRLALGD